MRQRSTVDLTFVSYGLATEIKGSCSYKSQRGTTHLCSLFPRCRIKKENECKKRRNFAKNCDLNLTSILASHQVGMGHYSMQRFFAFMGIHSPKQRLYATCEEIVGEVLISCAEKTMHDAREEEKIAAVALDPTCSIISRTGQKLVEVIIAIDMGWNKRSSVRR